MNNESAQASADLAAYSREDWIAFFTSKIRASQRLVAGYTTFIDRLVEKALPPIFEDRHLALLLGLQPKQLAFFTMAFKYGYRSFRIPKRSGGQRLISVPAPPLAHAQRWIDYNILRRLPVSECAQGYMASKSHITNAAYHINQPGILHVDIVNFFPSITLEMVKKVFIDLSYPPKIVSMLARLCTHDGRLPQGAPSSPCLSNVIFKPIDEVLALFAERNGLKYSRYVDDIIFSGDPEKLKIVKNEIRIILASFHFMVNERKTYVQDGNKKIVTGISIGTGSLKVPRRRRREYAQSIFNSIKRIEAGELDESNPLFVESELGKLSYWLKVDPDNRQARRLHERLMRALEINVLRLK
jgi:RNA-directed DNA polymerase